MCTSSAYWSYYCPLIYLQYKSDGGLWVVLLSQAGRLCRALRAHLQLKLGCSRPQDYFCLSGNCGPSALPLLPKEAETWPGGGEFLCSGWVKQSICAGFSSLFSASGLGAQGKGVFQLACCWVMALVSTGFCRDQK